MSWLDRLKSHLAPEGQATEPTKPGSVGFVASVPGASEISMLPIMPPRLRAASPANAGALPTAIDRDCNNCLHLLRHGTCGDPVGAGLMPNFGIVWPPDGHASGCAAFSGLAPVKKQDRPYRLIAERAVRCHTPCWDTAEIARFEARQTGFIRFGLAGQDADDLAEALTLRDREGGHADRLVQDASHPFVGETVGTLKKHATGKGTADKAAMVAAMREPGHNPGDDDEVDPLFPLHLALQGHFKP